MLLGYEANIGSIYYGPKWSWAEMVMGRNGHGPKWLWAEMTRNHNNDFQTFKRITAAYKSIYRTRFDATLWHANLP